MRTVLIVLFDGVQSLDVTGPLEVFAGAESYRGGSYGIRTASLDGTRSAPPAASSWYRTGRWPTRRTRTPCWFPAAAAPGVRIPG